MMFKQIFRLTVVTYVWKRYKSIIVSTVLLFAFFWLVGQIHQDYLSYSALNQDTQFIGLSFAVKWLVFTIGLMLYLGFNTWQRKRVARQKQAAKPLGLENTAKHSRAPQTDHTQQRDPFEAIRKRDKLRSRADFIINQDKP